MLVSLTNFYLKSKATSFTALLTFAGLQDKIGKYKFEKIVKLFLLEKLLFFDMNTD